MIYNIGRNKPVQKTFTTTLVLSLSTVAIAIETTIELEVGR